MRSISVARAHDRLGMKVYRAPRMTGRYSDILRTVWQGLPFVGGANLEASWYRLRNLPLMLRGVLKVLVAWLFRIPTVYGVLRLRVLRADGTVLELGTVCHLLVTTVGVTRIVDAMRNSDVVSIANFKYHGFGTGAVAPAVGDTALGSEATTQYNPNNTRPTGSQTTDGNGNVYRSVATYTPDEAHSPTEMGLFDAASAGDLFDRFTFTAVPLAAGDSLQTTVDITFPAGS